MEIPCCSNLFNTSVYSKLRLDLALDKARPCSKEKKNEFLTLSLWESRNQFNISFKQMN